jgi:hypothetical protein
MADPRAASAIDMVRFFFISSNMTLVLELRDTKESNNFKIFSKSFAGSGLWVAGGSTYKSLQPATCNLQPEMTDGSKPLQAVAGIRSLILSCRLIFNYAFIVFTVGGSSRPLPGPGG